MGYVARPSAEALCEKFVEKLIEEIGVKKVGEVRRLNHKEKSAGVCHSHDFCDANMVMLAAYCGLTKMDEDAAVLNDEKTVALWNSAWDLAKERHLS